MNEKLSPIIPLNIQGIGEHLLRILPGFVFVFSRLSKKLVFCTDEIPSMIGYSRQWLMEHNADWISLFVHPEDQVGLREDVYCQLEQGSLVDIEFRLVTKSQEILWIHSFGSPIYTETHGECILFYSLDESKSKLSHIRQQREIEIITNAIPGGVAKVLADQQFTILFASDGFYALTGLTMEEYNRPPVNACGINLVLPEDRPALGKAVAEQLAKNDQLFVEYRITKKDGSIAWISVFGEKMTEIDGIPVIEGVFIDSTFSKKIEHQLLSLTNTIPGGVAHLRLAEDTLFIDYGSDGLYRLTGYTNEKYHNGLRFNKGGGFEQLHQRIVQAVEALEASFELDYPIITKTGENRWVRARGVQTESSPAGEPCFECVFIDISDEKDAQSQLEMNQGRYQIIFERTQDIIFEWDIPKNRIYHSPSFEKKFGYPIPSENSIEFISKYALFPQDVKIFLALLEKLNSGTSYAEAEYRVRKQSGDFVWCKVKAALMENEEGQPIRVVGIINDIDQYIREANRLQEQAQKDLLTGLYNKISAQDKIQDFLENEGKNGYHALYLIDIDNFKGINDRFGHFAGDHVLTELSERIQNHFDPRDIIGRVGGDEFVVLFKNVLGLEDVMSRAEILCGVFHHSLQGVNCDYLTSGSVGVSLYPQDGKRFNTLYKKADAALYLSKRQGKDRYQLYHKRAEHSLNRIRNHTLNDKIESAQTISDNFSQYIFSMLYSAWDTDSAIRSTMELAARYFHLGHIYIFEQQKNSIKLEKTFEYYSSPPKNTFPNTTPSQEMGSLYFKCCNENGVFYCTDISQLPDLLRLYLEKCGVHCALHIPIMEDGICRGIVGFSESDPNRRWTAEEVDSCLTLGRMVSTFLLKRRSNNKVEEAQNAARLILQSARLKSYVVDDTFSLIYAGHYNSDITKSKKSDKKCYRILKNENAPCSNCPIHHLSPSVSSCVSECYNPKLHIWEELTASQIIWVDGTTKYLITCYDITKYKKQESDHFPEKV